MLFPGTYQDRLEVENFQWYAGFYLNFASATVMENNVVGGSDQAGYATYGTLCANATTWSNNEVHSAAFGLMLWRKSPGLLDECRRIDNVYAWRIWTTAFYIQTSASVLVEQVTVADSQLGINFIIFGPPALSHNPYEKTTIIKDSVFIGASPSHTCDYDDYVPSLKQQIWGGLLWDGGVNGGNTAFFIGSFGSGKNMAGNHPFHPTDVYPAISGSTHVEGVTFDSYKTRSCGKDVAISTNPESEDAIHPTFTSGLTFLNSLEANYIFMHEPIVGSINPSDCVDMTCDGHKKVIITDSDGTLLGTEGATATAIAEYEWDGDGSHGVGDYRIPNSLKTSLDGSQISAADKFPNKGIVRDGSCTLKSEWRAWKCTDLKHRMMVIESMDTDTEIRRLSPIALIANPGSNGYVDLLNGPMDRGWCFGYTCQERISTFYSVVASGTTYEMSLTSIPPEVIRFHLLHADTSEAVVIRIFFPKMQRYDIYVDDVYVLPKNIDTSKNSYQLLPEDNSFFPTANDAVGSNYLQRSHKLLHIVVKGGHIVDVKTTPAIVLSTGLVVDAENFFEENVVANLAGLLGVNVENIRVVNVIREDSSRRLRGPTPGPTEFITVEAEIASAPSVNLNGSTSTGTNFTGDMLSYEDLEDAAASIATKFQTGQADAFGISTVQIEDPIPPPPTEAPTKATEEVGSVVVEGGELYSNIQQEEDKEKLEETNAKSYSKPGSLSVNATVGGSPVAYVPIIESAIIVVVDTDGNPLEALGHTSDPWRLTATLLGGPTGAELLGDVEAPFVNGMANFSNIIVSKPGDNYSLSFELTYPENATELLIAMGASFSVSDKSLSLKIPQVDGLLTALKGFNFGPFIIWDDDLNAPIDSAALSGQKMDGQVSVVRGAGMPVFKYNRGRFSCAGEDIASCAATKLTLNNKPNVDVRFSVKASIQPAGWDLNASHQKGSGFVLLPKKVVIPVDASNATFSMDIAKGRVKKLRGKEDAFEEAMQKYLLKKAGKTFYSDVEITLNGKRASVNITVLGSPQQLLKAEFTICKLMKKFKLKVKVRGAGLFKFQNFSVDGDQKPCNRGRK